MRAVVAKTVSMLAVLTLASLALPAAKGEPVKTDGTLGVRVGGYMNGTPLMVTPDRIAALVPVGDSFGNLKLVAFDDTCATVELNGQKAKVYLDPMWQLAPYQDLEAWKKQYEQFVSAYIDSRTVDNSERDVFHIANNGMATSRLLKVQQAMPFPKLPDYMESVTVSVKLTPHEPTKVRFQYMTVTPTAYARLLKPLYITDTKPQGAQ